MEALVHQAKLPEPMAKDRHHVFLALLAQLDHLALQTARCADPHCVSVAAVPSSCTKAKAGQPKSLPASLIMQPCDAGTFASAAGSGFCELCPAGTYSRTGATSCQACGPGFWVDRDGTGHICKPCAAGSFSNSAGSSGCQVRFLSHACLIKAGVHGHAAYLYAFFSFPHFPRRCARQERLRLQGPNPAPIVHQGLGVKGAVPAR